MKHPMLRNFFTTLSVFLLVGTLSQCTGRDAPAEDVPQGIKDAAKEADAVVYVEGMT